MEARPWLSWVTCRFPQLFFPLAVEPFLFLCVKGPSTPAYRALSRDDLLLFVSYPACVYHMNRQWLITTDGCATVGCTTQQWRRMHGNAESWNWIRWLSSLFSSFVLHLHHKKSVCGRAFRIQPRVRADGVESPGALASLHQQAQGSTTNKSSLSPQGFSIHSSH